MAMTKEFCTQMKKTFDDAIKDEQDAIDMYSQMMLDISRSNMPQPAQDLMIWSIDQIKTDEMKHHKAFNRMKMVFSDMCK